MPAATTKRLQLSPDDRPTRLITTGYIAAQLGVPRYRVTNVVSRRGIRHVALAGHVRLFQREAIARIRYELNRLDALRDQREPGGGDVA